MSHESYEEYLVELEEEEEAIAKADYFLYTAADTIRDRAQERDLDEERSMGRCVAAFNEMFDKDLTEVQGWKFMSFLKTARSVHKYSEDTYVDSCAYEALAGEAAAREVWDDKEFLSRIVD